MTLLFTPNQDKVFVIFLAIGVVLGIIYDVFKVKRIIFGNGFWVLFFDDIIYSFVSCIVVLICTFASNKGIVRWYELLACVIGFFIYRMTASKIVIFVIERIVQLLKKCIRFMLRLLLKPLKALKKPVMCLINKLRLFLVREIKKRKILRSIRNL